MALGVSVQSKTTNTTGGLGISINKTAGSPTSTGGLGLSLGKTGDLNTPEGLQQLVVQTGLQKRAEQILSTKGEQPKQIFSGGFISDIFDALNALQYGVVGLLKGKGFSEGVKTRQSWSDKDALGDNGLPGVIGGIALDIACDPLTYIAPWTILKKTGLIEKLKPVAKVAEASKIGQWFGRKFVWMFGADPIFKEAFERSTKNIMVAGDNVSNMVKDIANLTPDVAKKILTKDETGRIARVGLDSLKKTLAPDEFSKVETAWNKIDDLGKQAVDAGLLSKGKFEENLGEYIKNAYTEYEQKKGAGLFGFMKIGIKGIKKRVPELTPEKMAELGQIDNPAYLLFRSTMDLTKDVENAKLFKIVNERFAKDMTEEGFKQLPITQRFITTAGKQSDVLIGIRDINQKVKPLFADLKKTFNADKKILSEIGNVEKQLTEFGSKRAEELTKFFQEGQKTIREVAQRGIKTGLPLVEKLPKDLFDIAQQIKRGEKYDVFNLEKLFNEGVLERNGFQTIKQFIDYVKKPAEIIPSKIIETTVKGNIPKIIKLQKNTEQLLSKSKIIQGVDKKSINDSFRFLEENINTLLAKKEELVEQLGKIRLGDLSGKFVPQNIFDYIQEISKPAEYGVGKQLVANFKFFKVIMNPATHARNIVSNNILNYWKLGMNPLDPRVIQTNATALKQTLKGGNWVDEAKTVGYNLNTFSGNEIKSLLDSPEAMGYGKKLGNNWGKIRNKLGDIYQGEESQAKLSAFIFNRKYKGAGIEDAWKAAESATFNYSQVTPFIRQVRESLFGFPFITFTAKATPIAVETALKAPQRISVFGKIKQAIENQSDIKETERERASEPGWIRDGFYIKLPIKDKYGRSAYFDMTYIMPFGDLVSGQFFTRQTSRETGLPESVPASLAEKSPFFNAVKELSRNQDFYGDKIWKDSNSTEKQLGDVMRYLTKTYLPPLVADQIPGGYMASGEQRIKGIGGALNKEQEIRQQRTLMEEMLRNLGLKIQPIDADIQETYMNWEKRKALETLLNEAGVTKQFERTYVPKK